jgi:hypothetical protein
MGYLRLCKLVGIDCSYPESHYTLFLDLQFKSYGVLKISAIVNAANFAQNCPKLPKIAKICQNLPKSA